MIDPGGREYSDVEIWVGGALMNAYALWSRTSFDISAGAQPGTCSITLKDPNDELSFVPGWIIQLKVNGDLMWHGYLMAVEQGYAFADKKERLWTLRGVDLNIILDKLVMYNHANLALYPDGGGALQRDEVGVVVVPSHMTDRDYLLTMMADFDIRTGPDGIELKPRFTWETSIQEIGQVNPNPEDPDLRWTPPASGTTLRALLEDVARNVNRSEPGSVIFYVSPNAEIVYTSQDTFRAPFSVTDTPTGDPNNVPVRELTVATDITRIKNDVLVFSTKTDPQPGADQEYLNYRHNTLTKSIRRYGRFQYTETLPAWTQLWINARSTKLLYQEGTPALTVDFVTYRHGFFPGQIVDFNLTEHQMWVSDYDWFSAQEDNWHEVPFEDNVPIRAINVTFQSPRIVRYRISCSFDTQDPWGLLLALKRPAQRGFVQPVFQSIDANTYSIGHAPPTPFYTYVTENPVHIGGGVYQCRYGYIRNSIAVYVSSGPGYVRRSSLSALQGATVGFLETDPDHGRFKLDSSSADVFVTYHKSYDINTA